MKRYLYIALFLAPFLAARAQESTNFNNRALDFESFRIIARNNIFDASRRAGRSGVRMRAPEVRQIVLLGVIDDNGTGAALLSSADSPLKTGDTTRGLKVGRMTIDSVELSSGSNTFVLNMDAGIRAIRSEDNGPWQPVAAPAPEAAPPPSAAASDPSASPATPPSGGNDSDVLKRLKERREQEDK